jgi:hypothetical protein
VTVVVELPSRLIAEPPAEPQQRSTGPAEWLRRTVATGATADDDAPRSAPRLGAPTRAEDVLGLGRVNPRSLWWSRRGATTGSSRPPAPSQPRRALVSTITSAGLPLRVPMAHLPTTRDQATPAPPAAVDIDPDEVGRTLSRFYGEVHRATTEDDDEDLQKVR